MSEKTILCRGHQTLRQRIALRNLDSGARFGLTRQATPRTGQEWDLDARRLRDIGLFAEAVAPPPLGNSLVPSRASAANQCQPYSSFGAWM